MVRPGISVLLSTHQSLLANRRAGVFTQVSGVLPDLRSSVDALLSVADVRVLFSPEHGLHGAAAEGEHIADAMHPAGLPIYSLYSTHVAPTAEQLSDVDVIVCDVQDIGCRFYTYAWTLLLLIEAAAKAGVAVIVADRPNPIGGLVEGPGIEAVYRTIVGLHDVPIRHGLTLGELVLLVNAEQGWECALTVVPCEGWQRYQRWSATMLPWVPPSPNMPTAETTLIYPGTCLLEGINVSVGRGTAKPFEWLGAPWIDGAALAAELNTHHLPGVGWRQVAFVPCSGPYAGTICSGVQPHVINADNFRPVMAGVALTMAIQRLYPEQLNWNIAHFDRLAGSAQLREQICADVPLTDIVAGWQPDNEYFRTRSASVLLYD